MTLSPDRTGKILKEQLVRSTVDEIVRRSIHQYIAGGIVHLPHAF